MNTATVPVAQSDTVTIDERLAQIEVERARITQLDEEAARLRHDKEVALTARRKEVIATIPALLQVSTLEDAITLMRGETKGTHKGARYPDAVRAQVKQAMEAGTPIAQIAKHMRIGEATLWLWKRYWGFTKTRSGRVAPAARRRKSKTVKMPMSEARKTQLIDRIKEGETPIAKLAREFGLSRARVYQIIAHQHLTPPSLQHAA